MWLLSTDRVQLYYFASPELVDGGYAILSHTWGHGNEHSFQDIQAINNECASTGDNPYDSPKLSAKIKGCCRMARQDGYKWVWIDSCCIDKTSSSELSEALNSMFLWYTCAEVCYAFLEDVPTGCDMYAEQSEFRTARWHTRGWTLQELIAPAVLVFVSQDWEPLGNKIDLARLIQQITGIWWQVLTREVHYSVISLAQRMSWASRRNTTRVEDEAYCLMGLFNVNMPAIYGEGRQAFQRLQREIMQRSADTSLFAWGRWVTNSDNAIPIPAQQIYQYFNSSPQNHVYLLAHSPQSFHQPFGNAGVVHFTPSATYPLQPYLPWQWEMVSGRQPEKQLTDDDLDRRATGPFGGLELPKFEFTSHGVQCRLPIIEVDGLTIAVLLCDTGRWHIGLILHPSNSIVRDPSRATYHCGHGFAPKSRTGYGVMFARLISLGRDWYNIQINNKPVTAQWRDIFIVDSAPPVRQDQALICAALQRVKPAPPFRVPQWLIGRLRMMALEPRPMTVKERPTSSTSAEDASQPFVALLSCENVNVREGLKIAMGLCAKEPSGDPPPRWAKAWTQWHANWGQHQISDYVHDCAEHHIKRWPDWTKVFGDAERTVRVSFSSRLPSKVNHAFETLVLHIELAGTVYEKMKKEKGVTWPPREPLPEGGESLEGSNDANNPRPRMGMLTVSAPRLSGDNAPDEVLYEQEVAEVIEDTPSSRSEGTPASSTSRTSSPSSSIYESTDESEPVVA